MFTSPALSQNSVTREFDVRCVTELTYGSNIIRIRIHGVPLNTVMSDMFYQRQFGTLKEFPPVVVDYLINIILIVYDQKEVYTVEGAFSSLQKVESLCLFRLGVAKKEAEDITT